MPPLAPWLALGVAPLAAPLVAQQESEPPAWFELAERAFPEDLGPVDTKPFDVLAADMDLDGDPDLLVNWHNLAPMEIFENEGGSFRLANPPGDDRSGLVEQRGVRDLFVAAEEQEERVRAAARAGLYLWHDADREGSWRLHWLDADAAHAGFSLELDTTMAFDEVVGAEEGELERVGERSLRIALGPARERSLRVKTRGGRLVLRLSGAAGDDPPALFVGAHLAPWSAPELELWKMDPHGFAWVDLEGSRRPELFITRGCLVGRLKPPLEPKTDRYYFADAEPPALFELAAPGRVPSGYERGRRIECVDVDGDGVLELALGNKESANTVLFRDPETGAFVDRAADLGLDFEGAQVQCWGDLDGDGREDLFHVVPRSIDVARRTAEGGYERIAGAGLGLTLPLPGRNTLFDRAALRLADFDGDGDLDLWLLAYSARGETTRRSLLFRRAGAGFVDVSSEVGLDAVEGHTFVLLDADNDGFEDLVELDFERNRLWRNRGGARFEPFDLPRVDQVHAATLLDADGDGRTDLALAGRERHLLRNVHAAAGGYVDVVLRDGAREPVGAVVRAVHAGGRSPARRYGSVHSTAFSQALGPLRFGIPRGGRIERFVVRWPGAAEEYEYAFAATDGVQVLERPR